MKILIKNGLVITMDDEKKEKYEKLDILINNDKIEKISKDIEDEYDKLIEAKDKIVMPGLINCHTHLGMSIFRSTNDNLALQDWLEKKIWPIENNMTDEDVYYASLLSCIEMIKTGTTCSNDMYFGWKGTVKAIKETKMRSTMSRCLIGANDKEGNEKIEDFKNLIETHKNDKLMTFTVTPHSLYTCSEDYLKKCLNLAKENNLPVHTHFCENKEEVENITKAYQKSPIEVLKDLDYLNHKLILAHGTFIDNSELLKNKDVSIVTNPISNLNLGCGIADLTTYRKNNINICLGSDGQGSGNTLNLFRQMSLVANLQKAKYKDPTVMDSYEVLKMATTNGAKALNLENQIGKIKENYKADIIVLDLNEIGTFPSPELIPQIVNNVETSNIITTIINGEIVMENKKLNLDIDEKNLKNKIKEIYKRLNI